MRQGVFEVLVVGRDGHVFPETKIGDRQYIRAVPGREYIVKVLVHRDSTGNFPTDRYFAGLQIDGKTIGYGRRLRLNTIEDGLSGEVLFNGFQVSATAKQAFAFTVPNQFTVSSTDSLVPSSIGSICVALYAAEEMDATTPYVPGLYSPTRITHQATEDKKFWQLPSLETAAGREFPVNNTPAGTQIPKWKILRVVPDVSLEIWYHNDDTLTFIKDFHAKASAPNTPAGTPVVTLADDANTAATPCSAISYSTKRPYSCGSPHTPLVIDLTQEEDEDDDEVEIVQDPGLSRSSAANSESPTKKAR